jgi:alpha-D-ribose 1-methylphosphonate 5-triphosphate synthase subunit PhnH
MVWSIAHWAPDQKRRLLRAGSRPGWTQPFDLHDVPWKGKKTEGPFFSCYLVDKQTTAWLKKGLS